MPSRAPRDTPLGAPPPLSVKTPHSKLPLDMPLNPIAIPEYHIYDIFYSDHTYVIISPLEVVHQDIHILVDGTKHKFSLTECPHGHTAIYTCPGDVYHAQITLSINDRSVETKVNTYADLTNRVLMATLVKDEDNYVRQWIEYHLHLGVQNFIIYDNSESNSLSYLLADYIETSVAFVVNWHFPYRLPKSGISGQTTQQNHAIYAFRTAKYIGLLDIDEYVNLGSSLRIGDFFDSLPLIEHRPGSLRLKCKLFYNPRKRSTAGYDFLKITNCEGNLDVAREKHFVLPRNVRAFSVHEITVGARHYDLPDEHYFNHYFYLNKSERGSKRTRYSDKRLALKLANRGLFGLRSDEIYFDKFLPRSIIKLGILAVLIALVIIGLYFSHTGNPAQ